MKHILIIEDDLWLGESYSKAFVKEGFATTHVRSAEHAMLEIDNKKPDVIVADFMLDFQNSLALFHELQSYDDTRVIPVILCSGLPDIRSAAESLVPYGIVRVLEKAKINSDELVRVSREVIVEVSL